MTSYNSGTTEQVATNTVSQCTVALLGLTSTAIKGNTKLGKRVKAAGLTQDYTKAYSIWNPGQYHGQSMDVKEAGARAYANVLTAYGFRASAGSRAD
tara:strand:+ start:2164 stop:2454 length:291 start_codon:yes stop_codon:yes gene_type:complete